MNKKTGYLALMALSIVGGFELTACDDNNDLADVVDDRLDDLDIDDDLVVTRTEWNNGFALFDDDNDSVLIFAEFRFNGTLFDLVNINGDAFVTEGEWDAALDVIDINNDDVIEESEISLYF